MPRPAVGPTDDGSPRAGDVPSASESVQVRFGAVMAAAERSGLLSEKTTRIGGRISPALLERAKRRTGIEGNTDLIAYALASLALEDDFAAVFESVGGTVDPDLKLGF